MKLSNCSNQYKLQKRLQTLSPKKKENVTLTLVR